MKHILDILAQNLFQLTPRLDPIFLVLLAIAIIENIGVNPWGWTLQVRKVWQGQDTL